MTISERIEGFDAVASRARGSPPIAGPPRWPAARWLVPRWLAARWLAFAAPAGALWRRRSIRSRLLLIVVALETVAAIIAAVVTVVDARVSTRVEIESSMQVARLLVDESLRLVRDDVPARRVLETLPLRPRLLRHVRLSVTDRDGVLVPFASLPDAAPGGPAEARAPTWFRALVAPPIHRETVPIMAQGRRIGTVELVSEPADEVAEAWRNAVALGVVAFGVNLVVLGSLHLLFGRALAPLDALSDGLNHLERRDYAIRLPTPDAPEFAVLTDRFNALAAVLEAARNANVDLSRRLITAEDDERRRTARELHDEVGPCLFGLKAAAASMARLAAAPDAAAAVPERVRDMMEIIGHLQAINRGLLNRLRPMALGHVPLGDLLGRIVQERARAHPDVALSLEADAIAASYGEAVDLTVYRCVQEGLTNAIRHAAATSVRVAVAPTAGGGALSAGPAAGLTIHIADDGCGFKSGTPWGFGLRGMQERVVALGGEFSVTGTSGAGTLVAIAIPLPPPPAAAAGGEGAGAS